MNESLQSGGPSRAKIVLAFAAIYVIWGSTYLAIRVAIQTMPPFCMAGVRFVVAGALLYAWMRWRGTPPPQSRHWLAATPVGALLLVGGNGGLVWAEQRVPSGLSAILLGMIPLWLVLLDSLRPRGPALTPRMTAGLLTGLAGIAVLVGPAHLWGSSRMDLAGASALMASAFCWAVGSLYSRTARLPDSPFLAAAMQMLTGGALLLVLGGLFERGQLHWCSISFPSVAAVLYLVVFGSLLGFTAYIWLLHVVPTSRVATYGYVNPMVAVFLGWSLGGESVSVRELLATVIIISAVMLILFHQQPPAAVAPDSEGLPTAEERRAMGIDD